MSTNPIVFIDGEAGTTGLKIREYLAHETAINVRSIDPVMRKDEAARAAMMREADVVVLCLPDEAAREAVALIDQIGDQAPRVLDASSAHRVADGWTYGFPEMGAGQSGAIAAARRVSNPGCYPTGAIALLRPLIEGGMVPRDHPVTVNAVSGYTGGGRAMIEAFEGGSAPAFELYGLALQHKHLPEMTRYSGLTRAPVFVPSVGNFAQGMLVSIPLHLDTLPAKPAPGDIEALWGAAYGEGGFVRVCPADADRLEPEALNGTNMLELRVYAHASLPMAVLVARLDNLGKGASLAAVQNLKLMLDV
ncbi:MAG: N-acetyl-gamma-glutamyl-phosphate reductase [Alphaproteobacteria bacterium]|nr:N-acetyl-gamma-glutamyl-phosphate reductase [Alphaproteobacteria bacterium]